MESRTATFESRWEALLPGLATKSDVAELKAAFAAAQSSMIKWSAGITLAALAVAVSIILFAINRIAPPAPPAAVSAPTQPIVIFPPAPAPPTPTK